MPKERIVLKASPPCCLFDNTYSAIWPGAPPVQRQNWGQLFQGQPGDGRSGGNRRIMGGTEGVGELGAKGKNFKKEEKESVKKNDSEEEQDITWYKGTEVFDNYQLGEQQLKEKLRKPENLVVQME